MADSDPRSDEDLIRAANRGDTTAFETLYFRYRDWVVSLAWRFTGSRDDALDVLQETFSYLLRKFPSGGASGQVPGFRLTASMKTFLYPAVKHYAIAARRKRRRFAGDAEVLSDLPAAREPSGASREELAAALGTLDDPHREVLLMRFVDGMTLGEISSALGIPLGTVKSRLHNALSKLRDDPRTRAYFEE